MKLRFIPLLLTALLASSALGAPRDFSKVQCAATPLGNGLQMLRWTGGNFAVGNMIVSVGSDGALLVDTGFPELADKLKAAVAELGPQPIRIVLNTHPHFDHVDGNEWLAGTGALIIAHERSRARMLEEQRLPEFSAKIVIPPYPKAALPVVTCRESLTLRFNGDEIRAYHVPNAHSDGDLLIQFVKANVLHTGDLFFPNAIPFIAFSGGGSLDGMIRGAEQILELCDENTRVVPGHGRSSNRDDVRAQRDLLVTIRDRLTQAIVAGKTVDEVVAANPLADLYQGRQPYIKASVLTRYGYLDVKRAAAVNSAPPTQSTEETAVRETDAAWAKAMTAKAVEPMLSFYDSDALTAGSAMFPARGLKAFRENWAKMLASPDFALSWAAEQVVVAESGRVACTSGKWTVPGSHDEGPYLAVWRKQPDGQWKVLVDAAWKDRPLPAAALAAAEARAALEAYILGFWNKHDTNALARAFAPTLVYHYNGEVIGGTPADHLGYLKDFGGAFPDLQGSIDHFAFSEGIGAASTTWAGTHQGELAGIAVTGNKPIPPTGRKVTIATNYVFRVESGRIVELWETWDEGTFYHRLTQPEPPPATK